MGKIPEANGEEGKTVGAMSKPSEIQIHQDTEPFCTFDGTVEVWKALHDKMQNQCVMGDALTDAERKLYEAATVNLTHSMHILCVSYTEAEKK